MSNSITTSIINSPEKTFTFNEIYNSYTITFVTVGDKTSIIANIAYTRPDGQPTILTKSGRIFTIYVKPDTSYSASFYGKRVTCYPATIEEIASRNKSHTINIYNSSPFTPISPTENSDLITTPNM